MALSLVQHANARTGDLAILWCDDIPPDFAYDLATPRWITRDAFTGKRGDCSDGKWKGEVTSQEHTPSIDVRPFAGHIASMGFAGTYTDDGAEFEATALVGKRSIRLKTVFRLLIAD